MKCVPWTQLLNAFLRLQAQSHSVNFGRGAAL